MTLLRAAFACVNFSRATLPLAACALALVGCAPAPVVMESPQSTTENSQRAKAAGVRPVSVGEFTAPSDKTIEGRYLRDTLSTELQGAGLLSGASDSLLQGELTQADVGDKSGVVAARFVITQNGRVVYDRELRATGNWERSPNVARDQRALYAKLVGQLFTDPAFKNAVPR